MLCAAKVKLANAAKLPFWIIPSILDHPVEVKLIKGLNATAYPRQNIQPPEQEVGMKPSLTHGLEADPMC